MSAIVRIETTNIWRLQSFEAVKNKTKQTNEEKDSPIIYYNLLRPLHLRMRSIYRKLIFIFIF